MLRHPALINWIEKNWHHALVLVILLGAYIAQAIDDPSVQTLLRFDRNLPSEYWRYLTCHFAHLSFNHLVMNFAGMFLLAVCFFRESEPWRDMFALAVMIAATSLGLYLFSELDRYVGFSGVLHGYWVFMLIVTWRRTPGINTLFLVVLFAKVLAEQVGIYSQDDTADFIGGPVATFSHLCGVLGALIAVGGLLLIKRRPFVNA